jgi:hypothetical protein
MKKILLLLALSCISSSVFADKPAPRPHHKKHHKMITAVVPSAPEVVIVPPIAEVVPPPVEEEPLPAAPIVAAAPVPVVPCAAKPHGCPPESNVFIPELHLGIGVGGRYPYASGIAGVRMEFPKAYLGIEPFLSIPYGLGADLLVYAYRGKVVQFYPLSVGFMINMNYDNSGGSFSSHNKFLSDQDINRVIDLRLGAGVQIKLACHVALALDWRASLPDPVKLASENGICHNCGSNGAVSLDAGNAIRNAFAQSQVIVGILVR